MNPKVQEFIDKMKAEQKEKELKEKEELLISLGLIDEEKSKKEVIYSDVRDFSNDWKWDEEKQKYYKKTQIIVPVEVTNEEYQEILKYVPSKKNKVEEIKPDKETSTADTIKSVAKIFLVLNIIGGLILFIALVCNYETAIFAWMPIASIIIYWVLWYPLIKGFSKIVQAAEKQL